MDSLSGRRKPKHKCNCDRRGYGLTAKFCRLESPFLHDINTGRSKRSNVADGYRVFDTPLTIDSHSYNNRARGHAVCGILRESRKHNFCRLGFKSRTR